ncbi:hypothetical protein ACWGJ9_10810 [Curtobacterium citreum]
MADIWFDTDNQFIGAIGPLTLRQLAEAIHDDANILAAFDFDDADDTTADDIENALDHLGVCAYDVDDDTVDADNWPASTVHDAENDQPARAGTTRVLGVHL